MRVSYGQCVCAALYGHPAGGQLSLHISPTPSSPSSCFAWIEWSGKKDPKAVCSSFPLCGCAAVSAAALCYISLSNCSQSIRDDIFNVMCCHVIQLIRSECLLISIRANGANLERSQYFWYGSHRDSEPIMDYKDFLNPFETISPKSSEATEATFSMQRLSKYSCLCAASLRISPTELPSRILEQYSRDNKWSQWADPAKMKTPGMSLVCKNWISLLGVCLCTGWFMKEEKNVLELWLCWQCWNSLCQWPFMKTFSQRWHCWRR